jgi:hypothetical protein
MAAECRGAEPGVREEKMMRKLVIVVGIGSLACAREADKVDTAIVSDSMVVSGAPAAPTTQPPAETARTGSPAAPAPSTTPTAGKMTPPPPAEAKIDSVRGTVSVVGTSFDKHVMIAERGTRRRVEVVGSQSALIGHVSGAEVAATGSLSGTQLNATGFVVRSVDGQAAIDGTLKTEAGSLFIVTAAGVRTRISAPPPPLVGHDGARVWITGDPAKSVSSFGFIDPPR